MEREDVNKIAKIIWNYHLLNQKVEKADCILVFGSHDTRVAERGAGLFLAGYAPLLMFSGGLGYVTKGTWSQPEADVFKEIALQLGVPEEKIIVENRSTNTGDNILFTKKLLSERRLDPAAFILVHTPYMERRTYATFSKLWPEKRCLVTSPQIPFEKYPNKRISEETVINNAVGYLQRLKIYPAKGFQIAQEIPGEVWKAYEDLVAAGYTGHLIAE